MYFPIGWPKVVNTPELDQSNIKQINCNRDRILFSILTDDSLAIWFCKPCVPIVFHRRAPQSLEKYGKNILAEWKPDSSMIVIATSEGHLLFYTLGVISDQKGLYVQTDSPHANLRRDSAELFIKEKIPPLHLTLSEEIMVWDGTITGIVCITMFEIMVATSQSHVLRYKWDGSQHRDYNLDLRRIPFCINQQVSKAIPIVDENTYIIDIEYSPLVGGFSIVFNDGRAAFLTASSLKFDPNQVQGIWAQNVEDATCTVMNHKYRLITFGRANAECVVYCVDESTGGLEVSHNCVLSSKDYPGHPGPVGQVLWTPDGCALLASWQRGGFAMWSTFGALLMCSLGWDYGLSVDIEKSNPLRIVSMQFAVEGYQLWMLRNDGERRRLIQLDFVKSPLAVNPSTSQQGQLYLQGDDKLYVNSAETLIRLFSERGAREEALGDASALPALAEGRQWLVIPVPSTYSQTNWPIRYSAIDSAGQHMAVAGRTGLAHYSMQTRRWKLFGNETQEKDFIVAGGLLWWQDFILMACYSILDNSDELRFYPRDAKLDNRFAKIVPVESPILLMNILHDQLITFRTNGVIQIWAIQKHSSGHVDLVQNQTLDISTLAVHPACVISITLTSLRTETGGGRNTNSQNAINVLQSIVFNVSGRLLMVQREQPSIKNNNEAFTCTMPTVLASCVENVWVPNRRRSDKVHLTEALWLFCGAHGMRVWLPLYPKDGDKGHSFMSKRIMLPFHLKIYPLAILFEDAIILGAENDTVLYTSDSNSPFSLPFNILQRTSQVYLHQILRQLIRRNLGYHAWEIAKSCMSLSYFPHSLELLLHEVLEEEATSKEPIPDAQLPSIIEFIMEFPVYLQTVVQCARKTEIALWPYLFSAAGKPKDLFQECMAKAQLETAASYLIILQNLETSSISRQYATLLLNTALDQSKWELAKDLVRFLRAIDPNEDDSPRTSFILTSKLVQQPQTPPVSPNAEDLSLILGQVQGPRDRVRSYSTTISPKLNAIAKCDQTDRKRSVPNDVVVSRDRQINQEEFFIDVILQTHARRMLTAKRLTDLGYFAAHLDFHLVVWLEKEKDRAARIDDFVQALKQLHDEFNWPYPSSPPANNTNDELNDAIFKIDATSRIGDSGYMSYQGFNGLVQPILSNMNNSMIGESELENATRKNLNENSDDDDDDNNVDGDVNHIGNNLYNSIDLSSSSGVEGNAIKNRDDSIMSVASSVWGGDDRDTSLCTSNWEVPSTLILEQLSNNDNKGSQRDEVQLRYLLQLFLEASCLEWALLISVLLRDAMAVVRTVNAAKSANQSINSVLRLRQGLLFLHYWTNQECLGYNAFMLAIQNQISVLSRIYETKVQQQKIVEYQQAVSASLNKVVSSAITHPIGVVSSRSRNTSQTELPSSQCNNSTMIKDKVNEKINEKSISGGMSEALTEKDESNYLKDDKNATLPESTGCVIF